MLWLIDVVGGAILLILFGSKAWESSTNSSRWIRLMVGSFAIGVVSAILAAKYYSDLLGTWKNLLLVFIIPLFMALAVGLEVLRRRW
jgi:tellurite resistance protein TehA-like permease